MKIRASRRQRILFRVLLTFKISIFYLKLEIWHPEGFWPLKRILLGSSLFIFKLSLGIQTYCSKILYSSTIILGIMRQVVNWKLKFKMTNFWMQLNLKFQNNIDTNRSKNGNKFKILSSLGGHAPLLFPVIKRW